MIVKELGTFHSVKKMYYKPIALYLFELDLDKNHCIFVDDSTLAELEIRLNFLNTQCVNNEISYTELVKRVNDTISDIAYQIHDLVELGVLSDVQLYILNDRLHYIINEAFTNIESPYSEQSEESDNAHE